MQIKNLFQSKGFQRLLVLVILALVLYGLQSMLNLILITFILTYLMDRFQKFISRKLDHFMPINRKLIIAFLYVMLIGGIAITLFKYLPVLTIQISQLIYQFNVFLRNPPDSELIKYAVNAVNHMELSKYVGQGVDILYKSITNVGKFGIPSVTFFNLKFIFLIGESSHRCFYCKI